MNIITNNECMVVSGGNVMTHFVDLAHEGLEQKYKTLGVAALSAGIMFGGALPFPAFIGLGVFATWAAYDMTGYVPFFHETKES